MKILVLLSLCLVFPLVPFSQSTPLPLPMNNIYWMGSYPVMWFGTNSDYGQTIHGTTIVNDTTYNVICSMNYCDGDTTFFPGDSYIREDSGKWFVRNQETLNQEALLFDFTSEVGDTLMIEDHWCLIDIPIIITSIDTIITPDGISRKRWFANSWDLSFLCTSSYCQFIEGIGSASHGIKSPYIGAGCIDENTSLICVIENNLKIYSPLPLASVADCCAYINTLSSNDHQSLLSHKVYPNPTENYITFEYENISRTNLSFEFHDYFGRLLSVPIAFRNEKSIRWNTSHLPAGVYVLTVISKDAPHSNITFTVAR